MLWEGELDGYEVRIREEVGSVEVRQPGQASWSRAAEPVARECAYHLARLLREADAARARATAEEFYAWLADVRGLHSPCTECSGSGSKVYGSTATWRGGVGGQMMTSGVCDKCWGSGDAEHHWPSWREREAATKQAEARATAAEGALAAERRDHADTREAYRRQLEQERERVTAAEERAARLLAAVDEHRERAKVTYPCLDSDKTLYGVADAVRRA